MNYPPNIKTNNSDPQPDRTKVVTNTYVTHSIYRINKPARLTTTFLHTNNSTINKSRNGNSPMSRNSGSRISPQNKSIPSPLPPPRNSYPLNPHTYHYRNYQPIYSTNSPGSTIDRKHYSRTSTNSPHRRGYPSPNKH